ncbi:ABC transporter substrate-binding protein [Mesorhizobium sp. L-8-3]|uniref:ABC transporter substrate-binding protein n=1 Tax=Mesorhizobium sp. L-8-3 TaxID=2744522 RepID=UPI001928E90C|nr:ABC transporter substrate-binding protein [Mesorhizobium sp. L-8-3]BCH21638.1 ABC transporter substrate-binding protein [Mesorhizobium sp. L-8-3]
MNFGRIAAGTMAAAIVILSMTLAAKAEMVKVTDVTGREVEVNVPVERVILGEGRQVYLVAALDTEDPFKRIVGWREDFSQADPDNYAAYLEKFPGMAKIPTFGGFKDGTFDVEQAVSLKPDVILMNIESKQATEDAKYIEKLAAAGIPLVYVDFRERPFTNTEPSMRLFGKLFGKEQRAEEFIAFRAAEIARVTDVAGNANSPPPKVFIERAGGYSEDCCMSFGDDNFGKFVEMAGATTSPRTSSPARSARSIPNRSSPRTWIRSSSPAAGGKPMCRAAPGSGVGPGRDRAEALRKLKALTDRPALTGVKAVENGEVHANWHQFYNSPYQFVANQQMAKWLHPGLFADLDPEATFRKLHEKFLPVTYRPGHWVSLTDVD